MASFVGASPGAMFIPSLLFIGIDARIAFATGVYLAMLTCLTDAIFIILYKKIRYDYAAYVQIFTLIGTVAGVFIQKHLIKTTGSTFFMAAIGAAGMITLSTAIMLDKIPTFVMKVNEGYDLFEFHDYCSLSDA